MLPRKKSWILVMALIGVLVGMTDFALSQTPPPTCPPVPPPEAMCGDRCDNDRDSLMDCRDSDCFGKPACVDADRDGFPLLRDCNDADPLIHPGAPEVCDGRDNDCDKLVDEGIPAKTFYRDADGDTFGTSATTMVSCRRPAGYVEPVGDCDDSDKNSFPGATEICDGKDNDCDGPIDDDDDWVSGELTWYADADGDSHGDAGRWTKACAQPSGYTASSDDCNDQEALAYTGATEICGDSVDNECDGKTDADDTECCEDLPLVTATPIPQPHLKRTGANLVADPAISSSSAWYMGGSGGSSVFDKDVSRTADGSGSIKFPSGFDSSVRQFVYLQGIPVTPGKTYVFSAYIKSSVFPPGLMSIMPGFRDASGTFLRNGYDMRWSNTGADAWQEIVTYYTTRGDEAYVELSFYRNKSPRNDGDLWIDDIFIGETDDRVRFEQPPTEKDAFAGTQTKVDALGNVEVLRNGDWETFFPLCMYGANSRDFTFYSDQGFNCLMGGANSADFLERTKNATSTFNPDGMLGTFDITFWTGVGSTSSTLALAELSTRMSDIKSRGLESHLFMYYWDNEFSYDWDTDSFDGWAKLLSVTDKVKELDLDSDGNRSRPIYVLQGGYGNARMYYNDHVQMTDVVGTYVDANATVAYSNVGGLDVISNIEGQTDPVVFAQMNLLAVPKQFRPLFYWAIARGARGMGFWRDLYSTTGRYLVNGEDWYPIYGPIENQSWWDDFPNIRREIDQMLPLIREPHWTSWQAVAAESSLKLGTRDYQDEGYIIAANMSDAEITTTITLADLYYAPAEVHDFFTDAALTTLSDGEFTVTLPAYGTAVYRLVQAPRKSAGCGGD